MALLPPTPVGVPPGHSFWNDWYEKLRNLINNNALTVTWNNVDFTGSNLTAVQTRNHDDLQNIGGSGTHHVPNYTEGTFTPTLAGLTTAGVGTYNTQTGRYTRIGNIVHVYILLDWSAHTGTGNMQVQGLPLTSATGPLPMLQAVGSNLTFTGNLFGRVNSNATTIDLRTYSSAAATAGVAMDTSASLVLHGFYYV
jgi:hypothetical protein